MNEQHTPGPWAVNPQSARIDAFTPDIVPICELLWPTDLRSEVETEANAHLIAAAPDLLDALQDALDNCLWRSEKPEPLSDEESLRLYQKAVSAIAKAKGKEAV